MVVLAAAGAAHAQPEPPMTSSESPTTSADPSSTPTAPSATPVDASPPARPAIENDVPAAPGTAPTNSVAPGQTPPRCCRKSPGTALALSLIPTLGGVALVMAGSSPDHASSTNTWLVGSGVGLLFVGPSLGHAYTRHLGSNGLALRMIGATAIGGCALLLSLTPDLVTSYLGAIGLCGGGGLAVLTGVVFDLVGAPGAARLYNRNHGLDAGITMVPMQTRSGLAPGFGLAGHI
jgi:hypothetical protein